MRIDKLIKHGYGIDTSQILISSVQGNEQQRQERRITNQILRAQELTPVIKGRGHPLWSP